MKLPTLLFCPHRQRPMPVRIDAKKLLADGLARGFHSKIPLSGEGLGTPDERGTQKSPRRPKRPAGGSAQVRWEGGVWPSGGLAVLREKCRCGAAELSAAHAIEAARVHPLRELATDQVIGAPRTSEVLAKPDILIS